MTAPASNRPDAAEAVFLGEFADQRGITRHLRLQLDRLAEVDIHRAGTVSWLAYVCQHSTRIAGAMARVQSANATAFEAMARLKKSSN